MAPRAVPHTIQRNWRRTVTDRARDNALTIDEQRGATFTVTNLGSLGTGYFDPIINWPEIAILGLGRAEQVPVAGALTCGAPFVWVHLTTNTDHAQTWLRDEAQLPAYVVDALTAMETRPRCEAFEQGALLNLRGRSTDELTSGDALASVRIWAIKGHVYSVSRRPLYAVDAVEKEVESGHVADPGDLISALATAITADLDPHVADLGDELDDCEERLDANRVFDLRRTVTRVRVAAIGYRRFLSPQRAALEKLAELPGAWLAEDDRQWMLLWK